MPFKIHEPALKKQWYWNAGRPQETIPEVLSENWTGTLSQGLPVVQIPHFDFPKVLYFHPSRPFREVEHRNDKFEVVGTERIPTEHLSRIVCCEAHKDGGTKDCKDCAKLLADALSDGWSEKPYIPEAPAKPDADLYTRKKK